MLGADVGLLAGLAVGTTAALPEETAHRLRERVDRVLQLHDFRGALEAEITEAAKDRWNLKSDQPSVIVDVELLDVHLASTRDERIRCFVKVAVTLRMQDANRPGHGKRSLYEYVSPYSSLSIWIDESLGLVEANLAAASRHLATQIVSGIAGTK